MRSRATAVAFVRALACGILAVLAATWHVPEPWLDGTYRTALYPAMQTAGTTLSNLIPIAGADLVIAGLLVAIALGVLRARAATDRRAAFARLGFDLLATGAMLVFCFYAFWGWWYMRPSVATRIDYDGKRIDARALARLAEETTHALNTLAPLAKADATDGAALRAAIEPTFQTTIVALGAPGPIVVSRTKRALFDPYMTATGVTGFMDPFGWDVVIQHRLTRFERPFTIAHEWTHLAGFANESEANFAAVLACTRATDAIVRYSGWINVYGVLPDATRRTMRLSPLVIADLTTIYLRYKNDIKKPLFDLQWKSYDHYLKANHIASGMVSYNEVTSLILGARFDPNGLPLPRPH